MGKIVAPLYITCMFMGGCAQLSFFLVAYSVDYINFFFGEFRPEFYLTFSLAITSLIGVLVAIPLPYVGSPRITLMAAYVGSVVFVLLIPIGVQLMIEKVITSNVAFTLLCIDVALLGGIQSYGGGAAYAFFGAHIGEWGIKAGQTGTVLGGIVLYIARIITKLIFPDTQIGFVKTGVIFYPTIALLSLVCVFLAHFLVKLGRQDNKPTPPAEGSPLLSVGDVPEPVIATAVFARIWPRILNLFLLITVVLAIYPGVFSVLHGVAFGWYTLALFGFFGISEALGQTAANFVFLYRKKTINIGLALQCIMAVFVFLQIQNSFAVHFFHSSGFSFTIAVLFGFNAGYTTCCNMVLIMQGEGPGKAVASTMALCTLQAGILFGSTVGVLLDNLWLQHVSTTS